jgi:phosphoribosylformimino-5-aminoimidazole carboxamide ribotide isomerase
MGGQVVHAQHGDRAHYRPIRSSLCRSAAIEDVVGGLVALHRFLRLYVADLNALRGGAPQLAAIDRARRAAGSLELWIDAGIRRREDLAPIEALGTPVLASETLSVALAAQLLGPRAPPDAGPVLSLDFRGDAFLGPPGLLQQPQCWPRRLIAMDLARVGSGLGPDLERIRGLGELAPAAQVYAAGGIRSAADLRDCRRAGAAGALVASSLHDGRLTGADLANLARTG